MEPHFYLGIWQTSQKKNYEHVTLKTINGKVKTLAFM